MHLYETGAAFAEGLALIASPCILPVLPLVLSASVDGGRRRPYGIITGFVLAFSLFALASRKLVSALHLDLDVIKYGSLVLLFLFGLVLLSSKLSAKFSELTQGAANFGNRIAGAGEGGFMSGIVIGALIGLVWTPCAGPILAAVLVQVIRQQSDAEGFAIIFAFALGAGTPMLVIAMLGRKIMGRLGFFTTHAEAIRKTFGVVIIAAVAFIASGADVEALFGAPTSAPTAAASAPPALQDALAAPYPAPEFAGIDAWINSSPLTMQSLRGKVVLIDFWTYSCINCLRTLPYITGWDARYRDKGLVIIGVHAPEFEFEKNLDNVKAAVAKHGIRYPVALDSELATWSKFGNHYWPAHYLIDRDGNVVYTHFGEGSYDVTENNIRYLLGLKDKVKAEAEAKASPYSEGQTPETYLGYERAQNLVAKDGKLAAETTYAFPPSLPLNYWALRGPWTIQKQKIISGAGAALRFHFRARKVFLVLGATGGKPVELTVALNGEPVGANAGRDATGGKVKVDAHRLYELIDQKNAKEGLLEISASGPGLEAYAFTFGQ